MKTNSVSYVDFNCGFVFERQTTRKKCQRFKSYEIFLKIFRIFEIFEIFEIFCFEIFKIFSKKSVRDFFRVIYPSVFILYRIGENFLQNLDLDYT